MLESRAHLAQSKIGIETKVKKRSAEGCRRVSSYALSFLVPALVMLVTFAALRVYPFGDNTLLVSDMGYQYIDFLSYLKSVFSGDNDLFYSFSKFLGGNVFGLWAYYLASPVNMIVLLFPKAMMPLAVLFIVVIKAGLCGLTFQCFLNRAFSSNRQLFAVVFSASYALSSYFIAYYFNIMWLDSMILLPLVILGIHKIIDEERPIFYTVCLFAAIVTCYYSGYMVCIFTIIYFVYLLGKRSATWQDVKKYKRSIKYYICYSLLTALLAAFILVPVYLSLQGGRVGFSTEASWKPGFDLGFGWFASRFFSNSSFEMSTLPNVFCGILPLILTLLFFLNKEIRLKEKILAGSVLAVLIVSFSIPAIDVVWHAFNEPHTFPARYSFVYIFFVLIISYQSMLNLKAGIRVQHLILVSLLLIGGVLVLFEKRIAESNVFDIVLILLETLIILLILYQWGKSERIRKMLFIALACLQITNLLVTAIYSINVGWNSAYRDKAHMSMTEYSRFINSTENLLDLIPSSSEMYRVEKTYNRFINDPMQFAYNGVSHAASGDKAAVKDFIGELGLSEYGRKESAVWASYGEGSTTAVDSLLGIKYLLSEEKPLKPYELMGEGSALISDPPYTSFRMASVAVYENPYALPLGFAVNGNALTQKMNQPSTFELQNDMYKNMVDGDPGDIFIGANLEESSSGPFRSTYTIQITNDEVLYMQNENISKIKINGENERQRFNLYDSSVMAIGSFRPGDVVTVEVESLTEDPLGKVYFYYEDADILRGYIDLLNRQPCHLEKYTSSHLAGTIDVVEDDQILLFTIPHDDGWSLWLDGEKQDTQLVFDALMAVPVSKGYHTVELKYLPEGLLQGTAISILAFVALVGIGLRKKANKDRPVKNRTIQRRVQS